MKLDKKLLIFIAILVFASVLYSHKYEISGLILNSKYKSCQSLRGYPAILECDRAVIRYAVRINDMPGAIKIYKQIIADIPNTSDCHVVGHEIGRDVFLSLKEGNILNIDDPLSECGYGFWHGFLSGTAGDLISGGIEPDEAPSLCKKIFGDRVNYYPMCYHGIGLGLVGDPPDTRLWGKPDDIVSTNIHKCLEVSADNSNREQCYLGVFHQLFNYMGRDQYGLKAVNKNYLLTFCNKFEARYSHACLSEIAPLMSGYVQTIPDVLGAVRSSLAWASRQSRLDFFTNAGAAVIDNFKNSGYKENFLFCFSLNTEFRQACLGSFYWNKINNSKTGSTAAVISMYEDCGRDYLSASNKDVCLSYLGDVVKNDPITFGELKTFCTVNRISAVCNVVK